MSELIMPPAWITQGLCGQADPDAWHPDKGGSPTAAKAICRRCEVRQKCLDWALSADFEPTGIWGGTTAQERRKLRRGEAA